MNKTITTPSGVPSHPLFVATTVHNIHSAQGERKLPWPTVRMLTCVNYLIPPEQKAVKNILAHAAQHVSADGLLCLSQKRLAHMSGYTPRSIRTAMATAHAHGYIKLLTAGRGRGNTPRYQILGL